MKRISSRQTFFIKRIFPAFWFGVLLLVVIVPFAKPATRKVLQPGMLIVPLIMAVFGIVIMKKLVFDLADEVWDDGDALLVKSKGWEERIDLSNIINVSSSTMTNPPRVTLTLREAGHLGKEITFFPQRGPGFLGRPTIGAQLVERIEEKRRAGR
jgi:hypothetical protein